MAVESGCYFLLVYIAACKTCNITVVCVCALNAMSQVVYLAWLLLLLLIQ